MLPGRAAARGASSRQRSAGIERRSAAAASVTSPTLRMPTTTLASAGCASENCSAAASSGTRCRAQTASMPAHARQDLGRRVGIPVLRAGDRAGGEDAGAERRREQDADALAHAERQQRGQRRGVEQRIAAGEHEAVEIAVGGVAHEDIRIVHADPDRPDRAGRAQLVERAIAAPHRLGIALLEEVALPLPVDVVDVHDVDARQAETLQRILDRTHRAVVGIVEDGREGQRAGERPLGRRRRVRPEQPADLGRQHERVPRHAAQALADAMLRQAVAVERRGVEVGHPGAARRGGRRAKRVVAHLGEQVAERSAAEAEGGYAERVAAEGARRVGGRAHRGSPSAQAGEVVDVDVGAGRDRRRRRADRLAVLAHRRARGDRATRELVPERDVGGELDLGRRRGGADADARAGGEVAQRHRDVVGGIEHDRVPAFAHDFFFSRTSTPASSSRSLSSTPTSFAP